AGVSFDAGTGPDAGKVYEHGLESVADASETTDGKITVTATDGVASVTLGTDTYDLAHLDGQTVDTGKGVLTVTGHTVSADGKTVEITYSYTLSAAQTHADGAGNNTVQDSRSEEHTSELQSRENLVCRLLLEKKKQHHKKYIIEKNMNGHIERTKKEKTKK